MFEDLPKSVKFAIYVVIGLSTAVAVFFNVYEGNVSDLVTDEKEQLKNVQEPSRAVQTGIKTKPITIFALDRVTRDPIKGVSISLIASMGATQEELTDETGDTTIDIPSEETVRIYLRKADYQTSEHSIDLRRENKTNYIFYLQKTEDIGKEEVAPPVDSGSGRLDEPELGIGESGDLTIPNQGELLESEEEELSEQIFDSTIIFNSETAISLIEEWLQAKKTVFASPYDKELAQQLITGKLLEENLGSIDWLESSQWEYFYKESRVVRNSDGRPYYVDSFVSNYNEGTAAILVKVNEERLLRKEDGRICEKQSGASTADFLYTFQFIPDSVDWKISDFCKINRFHECVQLETGC